MNIKERKEYNSNYYLKNKEKIIRIQKYRRKCHREQERYRHKKYRLLHKSYFRDYQRNIRKIPEEQIKIKARNKAGYYIPIPYGQKCQAKNCDRLATERHHPDYNKPLKVKFLCSIHNRHK